MPKPIRPVRVCDHALLRFIERVGGLDTEGLRGHIEGSLNRAVVAAGSIGSKELTVVADGLRYVIVNSIVVTVLSPNMTAKRPKRSKR
ncbi:hypothetical protein HU230_0008105 [Bradyrhizobium quebecense]|uniref:Uncharacterized protein n=1 Tax=Bradyrhizobium quebecense TaxID=2748629 RepID=A0A973WST2_9BRAD|nr:hypothetical protein [Bradyrhizobium quebecense]UGA45989.1 hypothetical protein HU230_0008105 [Bradyrhizobium quebecense]